MTLPTSRGFARATLVSLALALAPADRASAQDCWLPDAFEPNDAVAAPLSTGSYSDLTLHAAGLWVEADRDRFAVTIPPYQRLTLDVEYDPGVDPSSYLAAEVRCTIEPTDGSTEAQNFWIEHDGPGEDAAYDNPFGHALDVVVELRIGGSIKAGCLRYDLHVALGPRPCDTLPDDALEGPDDCGGGTVLQPGLHADLVVFNSQRLAGRDGDAYRISNVPPGEHLYIRPIVESGDWQDLHFDVFRDADCGESIWDWSDNEIVLGGSGPQECYVRVHTTSPSGFQRYAIDFRFEACALVVPDAFEPNDRCGPYTPITLGTWFDLTLGPDDVDAFEVVVPPYERLRVVAHPHVDPYQLSVRGAELPDCPNEPSNAASWLNDGPAPKRYRFSVEAVTGGCTSYDLEVSLEAPYACSDAAIAHDEPNDDCATATPFAEGLLTGQASRGVTLHPGDADCFRIEIPANSVWSVSLNDPNLGFPEYQLHPTILLEAFPSGNCNATPVRVVRPHLEPDWPGSLPQEIRLYLSNRTDHAEEWVVRVSHGEPVPQCRGYLLVCDALERDDVLPLEFPMSNCESPIPLRDGRSVRGPLAPGKPLFGSVALQPGHTIEVEYTDSRVRSSGSVLQLALHAGSADCANDGATLGVVTSDPQQFPLLPASAALRLVYTNTNTSVQRVVAELRLGPQAGEIRSGTELMMTVDGGLPYTPFCSPVDLMPVGLHCPCDNRNESPSVHEGCSNSTGSGAWLHADGSASVAADDLTLHVEGLPPHRPAILFHSYNGYVSFPTRPFFDGLLCISNVVNHSWRLTSNANGAWTAPAPAASTLASAGPLPPSSQLQCWYRDPTGPCGARSNTSNAIWIQWLP